MDRKIKALLAGKNQAIIDEFFLDTDVFEVQYSSSRYEDLLSHVKYFQPDIFVFCMDQEKKGIYTRMSSFRNKIKSNDITFVIIGTNEDCDEFFRAAVGVADIALKRPITMKKIEKQILDYMNNREREREYQESLIKMKYKKELEAKKAELEATKKELEELEKLAEEKRKKHILVVDDDARMIKIIKEHLNNQYDVAAAINGKLAIKFLEKKTTDLILLDYVMPGEDGPAVLKKIHENPATRDIPVIFLTGMTEKEKIAEALSEKPQGYLLKPIDRDKLIDAIEKILDK